MGRPQVKEIRDFLERVRKKLRPQKIILFGSRVRGEALEESDFDLIIVSSAFRNMCMHDRIVKVLELHKGGVGIEPICLTPEEFEKKSKEICVVKEAVREGIDLTRSG
jgi:predicted nucleotidyltransferase